MPRFSLKQLFMSITLIAAGLAGITVAFRGMVDGDPELNEWLNRVLWFGGVLMIGVGVLVPFGMTHLGIVAFMFAAIAIFGEVWGCVALLGLGVLALIVLPRDRATDVTVSPLPQVSHFVPWGVSILLFACFVSLLAPFAFPPVVIALLILSPLFGTLAFLVSSVVCSIASRR